MTLIRASPIASVAGGMWLELNATRRHPQELWVHGRSRDNFVAGSVTFLTGYQEEVEIA